MKIRFLIALLGIVLLPLGVCAEISSKLVSSYNMSRALELIAQEEYQEAFPYLEKEINDNKENYYAHYLVAKHHMWMREYGLALKSLNLAEKYVGKKDENMVYILELRSDVYLKLQDDAKAKADLDKAVKLFPKSVKAYVNRSNYYVSKDQFELAENDMEKAMSIDETDRNVRMEYAIVLRNLKKYDKAISNLDYLIRMYPKDDYAYFQRSLCEEYSGDFESAADDILRVDMLGGNTHFRYLALADSAFDVVDKKLLMAQLSEPRNPLWLCRRGTIRYSTGDYKGAIKMFEDANNIKYSDINASFIATCWSELGNLEMSLKVLNKLLESDSTDTAILLEKISCLEDMGRYEEALEVAEKMVFVDPSSYTGYFAKACVEKFQGNISGAIDDFTMASIVNDKNALIYLQRGYLFRLQGDEKSAAADFRKVLEIDTVPKFANKAMYAHAALGNRDKAVALLDSILKNDAKGNYYEGACLYARMNESENSLKYLKLAFESGYRGFGHIKRDEDLDNVRNLPAFKEMVAEYQAAAEKDLASMQNGTEIGEKRGESLIQEVPFYHESGVTKVKCTVNNLPLHFVFDTGASDVTISMVEATFMLKNGYLSQKDFSGKQYYQTADGTINEGATLILKSIKIGDLELHNVRASVVKSQTAPLLLGQSVLQQLGKIEIDNSRNVLRITYEK